MARTFCCTVIPRSVGQTILAFSVLVCPPALAWYQAVETVAISKDIEQGGSPAQDQVTRPATRPEHAIPAPGRTRAEASEPRSAEPAKSKANKPRAFQVFRDSCIECHDADGRGESNRDLYRNIPDFTNPAWQSSRTDGELSHSILEGKGKSMPAMKEKVSSVGVMQMVALIREFRGGKLVIEDNEDRPPASEPMSTAPVVPHASPRVGNVLTAPKMNGADHKGNVLFQQFCVRCHAADGKGARVRQTMPTIPDFTLHAWQEGRNDPQLLISVLDGKGTRMPPFRDKLTRDQARDLVALVRAFDRERRPPAETAPDLFDTQFRQLEQEFERLRKQSKALSSSTSSSKSSTHAPSVSPSSDH
jgi:mono/diheme cytochrome c family protein